MCINITSTYIKEVFDDARKNKLFLAFVLTSLAGVLLHFAYDVFPITPVALIAPINESLWEHVKLVFFPAFVAALILTRKQPEDALRPWLLSTLLGCAFMLIVAYIYHVVLGGDSLPFDIGLYFVTMALIFVLAPRFRPPYTGKFWSTILLLSFLFALVILIYTYHPPAGAIFQSPV